MTVVPWARSVQDGAAGRMSTSSPGNAAVGPHLASADLDGKSRVRTAASALDGSGSASGERGQWSVSDVCQGRGMGGGVNATAPRDQGVWGALGRLRPRWSMPGPHVPRVEGRTFVECNATSPPPSLSRVVSTAATWGVLTSSPPRWSPRSHTFPTRPPEKVLPKHPRDYVLPCSKPPVQSAHHGPPDPSVPAPASPPACIPPQTPRELAAPLPREPQRRELSLALSRCPPPKSHGLKSPTRSLT